MTRRPYSYTSSLKSNVSDEIINIVLIRPLAGVFVRLIFHTRITPNHVTLLSTLLGLLAALQYLGGTPGAFAVAGLLVTAKDVLDAADGQLARAKQQFSRRGRFLDSLGDFAVNAALCAAIGTVLYAHTQTWFYPVLALLSFLGITLRVSYHVYYQTAFLHLQNAYAVNRLTEELRPEDLSGDAVALTLQKTFQMLYGWQDRVMVRIDRWCRGGRSFRDEGTARWYSDPTGLRLSGLLGLGTEMFVLMLFSIFNNLEAYLLVNVVVLNGIWLAAILYRRFVLAHTVATVHLSR